ncbi:hypothetical protein FGE12_18130 [Aggregicoccus sp. 17bor-14]|uniref:hypothetical protein n=1 Tax=Myxococcaceae TaxID=31 RepID=UPI00129C6C19|nr:MULTISPECIES: hypothetical protein [Myxococcaceae]MBF5044322.1 hypothetical protein [Simulacricoccus sp. 17bor-14]MRI90070.1 hypothetical protein [Aggregicoccus sp. 17bor-14]
MLRRAPQVLLLTLLALAVSCSRCGKGAPGGRAELRRFLPRAAQAVIVVPEVGVLGEKLARFQQLKLTSFAAQLEGFPNAESYVNAAMRQLGVDVRSRAALEAAGIAPERGAGVAMLGPGRTLSVLGVKDAKALESTFASLARNRLGAGERAEVKVDGHSLVTFRRRGAALPVLGLLFVEDYALVGAGAIVGELGRLAALPPEQSLLQEPVLSDSLSRLPKELDLYAFLPGGGGLLPQGTVQGLTLTGLITPDAVTVRADAPWPDREATLAVLDVQKGPELLGYLPADSFLVARFAGDPAGLDGVWPYIVGAQVTRAVQESGFDFRGEVLQNLKSGAVAGVSLAPTVQLGAGVPALDLRRTNPFRFVQLAVITEVKDPKRAAATLEKLPPVAERFGAQVRPAELKGQRVYLTSYRQGEGAHLAQVGERLVLAAPQSRLESLLGTLAGKPGAGAVAPELAKALEEPGLGVVLDLRRFAQAVKDLPSEAWGLGGFAIKDTTVRWLEATDDLRAVTFGLSRKQRALQAELSLKLVQPQARDPK